jgi:hypothetical protein
MDHAQHVKLSPEEVEDAIRKRVRELAAAKGIQLPPDEQNFHRCAKVHFMPIEDSSPEVTFKSVIVSWEGD